MNLILMGPPGAGKGTQSALLGDRLKEACISTGNILREEVRRKSPLGTEAKRHMDKGELVPDDVMIGVIEDRLRQPDCDPGFILDGFPRTVPQAEALDRALRTLGRRLDVVVSLAVPNEELIKRLSGRRTCRECGALYHIIFDPPTNAGICNKCNGDLYQRDDDQEDIIVSRLEVYTRETAPLLQYYRARNLLAEIDGTGGREDILARIVERLENRL
ncbi:MAG: adenylate kinase [Deltaproteobacteria bacterium]|nr:adenylate kinase [Deltaproteobacteria bacterium]